MHGVDEALLDDLYLALAVDRDTEAAAGLLAAAFDAEARVERFAAASGDTSLVIPLGEAPGTPVIRLERPPGAPFSGAEFSSAALLRAHARRAYALGAGDAFGQGAANDALAVLTPAEHAIVRSLFAGRSYDAILRAHAISMNTLKWHLKNIYAKLEVGGRDELLARLNQPSNGAAARGPQAE
jgi:DNA-binding CsgD family transcriptional regulator